MGLTKPIEQNLLSYQGTFMYLNILYEEEYCEQEGFISNFVSDINNNDDAFHILCSINI